MRPLVSITVINKNPVYIHDVPLGRDWQNPDLRNSKLIM